MPTFRYRDEDDSPIGSILSLTAGALAGFAVGVLVAQRTGGLEGLAARFRQRAEEIGARRRYEEEEDQYYDGEEEALEELEDRVLEAFRNDPILSERAIDIGAIGDDIVELTGWVETDDEAEHAVTVAGGVPGVESVVNRLAVADEEEEYEDAARRVADGDPALTEARWEGVRVGTGRRRQGTSDEADRHADPRVELEDRWLDEEEAIRNAAEPVEGITAERRRSTAKKAPRGGRGSGEPVSPSGVPKADHVENPSTNAAPQPGRSERGPAGEEGRDASAR